MTKKIVIIGGGGSGLAALNAFVKAGFTNITLFEKENSIGGVWYTTNYPNLHIHSKSFNYRFIDFHPIKSEEDRATRDEVLTYMNEFVDERGIRQYIKFNTHVDKIIYNEDASEKKCKIFITDLSTNKSAEIQCDYVICALGFSNAGKAHIPTFIGEKNYTGKIIHSSEFNQAILNDIIKNNRKVVLLGAGKSAQDILPAFKDNLNNIIWLYKKSLWCVSFDKLYDGSFLTTLLEFYFLFTNYIGRKYSTFNWLMYLVQRPLVWGGLYINPLEDNTDLRNSRAAILKHEQYEFLKTVKSIKSEILKLDGRNVFLANGQILKADYLICATGYERAENLPPIIMTNTAGDLKVYDPKTQHSFFRNMIDPNMPEIALFTADMTFAQQLYGFSISAEWLTRFYAGKLVINYSLEDIKNDIKKNRKDFTIWCPKGKYLSKGLPYAYSLNQVNILPQIFQDMGIDKTIALKLFYNIGNQEKFNHLSEIVKDKIKQSKFHIKPEA